MAAVASASVDDLGRRVGHLGHGRLVGDGRQHRLQVQRQIPQPGRQIVRHHVRLADPPGPPAGGRVPVGAPAEEHVGGVVQTQHVPDRVVGQAAVGGQHALAPPGVEQHPQGVPHAGLAHLQPEVLAGHVLDRVGLVQDQQVVLRQVAHAGHPQRQIAEQQRVVDHQHVGPGHPPAGRLPEAVLVERALLVQAVAGLGAHLVPHARLGRLGQLAQRPHAAGLQRLLRPVLDHHQRPRLRLGLEQVPRPPPRLLQPPLAQVVVPPLDQHGRELAGVDRRQQRDVLLDQLLLQRDRVRADDDPLLVPHGVVDRRQQVGEALAHAGAGLDQQVVPGRERRPHGLGHLQLLRAVLVPGAEPPRDRPVRPQDVVQRGGHRDRSSYPNGGRTSDPAID